MTNLYACDCVRFHMHVMCVLVCMGISRQNSFQGGGECRENFNFSKKWQK